MKKISMLGEEDQIIVSVCMLTYNHEKYICQAIESILMQQVSFKYELVIGDDCSSDQTKDIILKYKDKYPEIIVTIFQDKNIGVTNNLYSVLCNCKGKYVAYLEGDDYWNTSYKLQKQVNLLEIHTDFIGVAHSCNVLTDNGKLKTETENFYHCNEGEIYTFTKYKEKRFPGHTSTILHRNIFLNPKFDYSIIYKADKTTGDRTIVMLLVGQGNIYCMSEEMSTYRAILQVGATNINSLYIGKNRLFLDWEYETRLDKYCMNTFGKSFLTDDKLISVWLSALKNYLKQMSDENKKVLCNFNKIIYNRPIVLCYVPKVMFNKSYDFFYRTLKRKN